MFPRYPTLPSEEITNYLTSKLHDPDNSRVFHLTLMQRIINLFHPFEIKFDGCSSHLGAEFPIIDLPVALATLGGLGQACAAMVMKTWLNGWVTSHRMHCEVLHSCLLGCPGAPDSLAHYIMCPGIYAAMAFTSSDTSSDPVARLGLFRPSALSL